jgi:hypothetical protein
MSKVLTTYAVVLPRNFVRTQSIYRKVAPGRLFTFKFLLFSLDIKNCNPSQWCHSIVWFTRWHHFSVHPDDVIAFFNSFFPAFWKFESDITYGSTFLYILWCVPRLKWQTDVSVWPTRVLTLYFYNFKCQRSFIPSFLNGVPVQPTAQLVVLYCSWHKSKKPHLPRLIASMYSCGECFRKVYQQEKVLFG